MARSSAARVLSHPFLSLDLGSEWVGGLVQTSIHYKDRNHSGQILAAIWLERPSKAILACHFIAPEKGDRALGLALRAALSEPKTGYVRYPDRIRVAHSVLARDVHVVIGYGIPIVIAPTPELFEIAHSMIDSLNPDDILNIFHGHRHIHPVKHYQNVIRVFTPDHEKQPPPYWAAFTNKLATRLDQLKRFARSRLSR